MNSDSNQEFLERFQNIEKEYLKNPDSEEIGSEYLKMLRELALKQEDKQGLRDIANKAEVVYKKHLELDNNANNYLWVLYFLASKQEMKNPSRR